MLRKVKVQDEFPAQKKNIGSFVLTVSSGRQKKREGCQLKFLHCYIKWNVLLFSIEVKNQV